VESLEVLTSQAATIAGELDSAARRGAPPDELNQLAKEMAAIGFVIFAIHTNAAKAA
jgi:hypothetical protein